MLKKIIFIFIFLLNIFLFYPPFAIAQDTLGTDFTENIDLTNQPFLDDSTFKIFLNLITLLTFGIAVLCLCTIIQGWFNLYTASGNEDKVYAAKHKMIFGGIFLSVIMTIILVGNHFINKTEPAIAGDFYEDSSEEM